MSHKNKFDKLSPANQVAIEAQMQKAKKEDLEYSYKEQKARETLDKKPLSAIEIILLIILLAIVVLIVLAILLIPSWRFAYLQLGVKAIAPDLCAYHNSTYINTLTGPWVQTIQCSNGITISIP